MILTEVQNKVYATHQYAFKYDGVAQSIVDLQQWITETHTAEGDPQGEVSYVDENEFTVDMGWFFGVYTVTKDQYFVYTTQELPGGLVSVQGAPYGPISEIQYTNQFEAVS